MGIGLGRWTRGWRGMFPSFGRQDGRLLALLAVLVIIMTWPLAVQPGRLMLAAESPGDAFIFLWNFWWTNTALLEQGANPYFTRLLDYPAGVNLALHTFPLGYGLLSLPVQPLVPGLTGLITAYNLVVLFSFFIAGAGMYGLAYHVSRHRPGAMMAAAFYAFANYRFAHMVRLHCLSTEWLPFFVWFLLRWAETGRRRDAVGCALAGVAILYSSLEYLSFMMLLTPLLLMAIVAAGGARHSWRRLVAFRPLSAALLTGLLLALPLLVNLVPDMDRVTAFHPSQQRHFSADAVDFLIPNTRHPLWGEWSRGLTAGFHDGEGGFGLSLGYVGLALFGVYLWVWVRRRSPLALPGVWPLAAVLCLVLALGPYLHLAGHVYEPVMLPHGWLSEMIPSLRASRAAFRWIVPGLLFMAVTVAGATAALAGRLRAPRRSTLLAAGMLGFLLFEQWAAPLPLTTLTPLAVPACYADIATEPATGSLIHVPELWCGENLLLQTLHRQPIAAELNRCLPQAVGRREVTRRLELLVAWRNGLLAESSPPAHDTLWAQVRQEFRPAWVVVRQDLLPAPLARRARERLAAAGPVDVRPYEGATVYVFR